MTGALPAPSAPTQHRTGRVLVAGADETGFVGKYDCLHSVAKALLLHDMGEVGLYCRLAEKQVKGDLGVGVAAADMSQYLDFAFRQVSQSVRCAWTWRWSLTEVRD